jgi:hypothetical protein
VSEKKPEGPIEERDFSLFGHCRVRRINNRTFDLLFDDDPDRQFKRVTVTSHDEGFDEMFRDKLPPDVHFLFTRMMARDGKDTATDAWRRAFLELLRNHQRLGIELSQEMINRAANELESFYWPDPKAEKHRRRQANAEMTRTFLGLVENMYRRAGEPRPRSAAKDKMAQALRLPSGEALRKALQVNRVNRKPRRTTRLKTGTQTGKMCPIM